MISNLLSELDIFSLLADVIARIGWRDIGYRRASRQGVAINVVAKVENNLVAMGVFVK